MKQKIRSVFGMLTAALLMLSGCEKKPDAPDIIGDFTITALDVGKADAFVLRTASHTVVVDAGNKGDGKDIEKFLASQNISKIDALIITHFDKDHVGGAARLVKRLEIGTVYLPDYRSDSDEYEKFEEKMADAKLTPKICATGSHTDWVYDDVTFSLDAAEKTDYGKNEENDFSLSLYMQHGENTFLFAGDAEEDRQQEIIDYGYGGVTFLKFPYHGKYLPTTEAFLDHFKPQATVVCCSEKEYAQEQTVAAFKKRGISAYYTADGDVTIVSNGKELKITQ